MLHNLVRPLLEYACTVWDPFTNVNIQKLESVQRRSAWFVINDYRQTSSLTSMLNTLTVATISREKDNTQSYNDVQNSKWRRSNTTA
jgi:hypothetical protein